MPNPVNHLLGQGNKMSYVLSHADSTYDMRLSESARTARNPANQYLLLDSRDRLPLGADITSPTPTLTVSPFQLQPWNDFQLQRPQSLMEAFAKRIAVSEVRLPFLIPNVNSYNNTFAIRTKSFGVYTTFTVTIPIGFYTSAGLASAVQTAINALLVQDAVTFTYASATNTFTLSMVPTSFNTMTLYFTTDLSNLTYQNFSNSANFFTLVGFPYNITGVSMFTTAQTSFTGSPTEALYTQYVDILSNKFHQFTNVRDGNSDSTSTAVVARIYINDNVSINEAVPIGQAPITIHRQFKNPKFVRWNSESVIDWLDIKVVDQFGNLVPLPPPSAVPGTTGTVTNTYPNFQITLLASED